jgi:pyruvate formate lyase activating enzyme
MVDSGSFHYPFGYVSSLASDPIEKKPLYHVLPGADALSFGMLGCNLRCDFCQNWDISMIGRDPFARGMPIEISAEEMVVWGVGQGARIAASTYNEPLITSEWAMAVFQHARKHGMLTGMVSNGNATEKVLDFLRPQMDFFKIDLKTFNPDSYHQLGGSLRSIRKAIEYAKEIGLWVEIVTLIVPGFNDSIDEIRAAAKYLKGISPEIPWHFTAFHPDYKRKGSHRTTTESIMRLAETAQEEGMQYIYVGNTVGGTDKFQHTHCPQCHSLLIRRRGFSTLSNRITNGRCPDCQTAIPGIWG